MKYIYSYEGININEKFVQSMSKQFLLDKRVVQLLYARGINTEEKLYSYLNPSVKDLNAPFLFEDMTKVCDLINSHIQKGSKILIYGDYDVDGISATYTLYDYFNSIGCNVSSYIPNRYFDGYGLNIDSLTKIIENNKPDLVISVDCGITAIEEVKFLKNQGIDVIITDHHEMGENLPDCLIINAKISKTYPFRHLCGAGVAFKLVHALAGIDVALEYLPVTSIATIADIVDLTDENRAIVSLGIKHFEKLPKGLQKMMMECGINRNFKATDIAFKLAPKINASGRMGDANLSLQLYLEKRPQEISKITKKIIEYNTQRQQLCNKIYNDVKDYLNENDIFSMKAIILSSPTWEVGMLGIVASKICAEYNRPTCLFSQIGDELTGSCRSVNGVNIHTLMCTMPDILEKFGGHTMAAGITLNVKNYDEFCNRFNKYVNENLIKAEFLPTQYYDFDIPCNEIDVKLIEDIERMEPCGLMNTRPIFKLSMSNAQIAPMKNHPEHLRVSYPNMNLLAFNSANMKYILSSDTICDLLVDISLDQFKNSKKLTGIIQSIDYEDIHRPNDNNLILAEYVNQLSFNDNTPYKFNNYNRENLIRMLVDMDKNIYGNLIVANDYNTYLNFKSIYDNNNVFRNRLFEVGDQTGINTILLAPKNFDNFNTFNKIIFLDPVLHTGYLSTLNKATKANIYLPHKTQFSFSLFKEISLDRSVFGKYYRIFQYAFDNKIQGDSAYNFYAKLVGILNKKNEYNYLQFVVCLTTFGELGLIEFKDDMSAITKMNNVKKPLNASAFYNRLNIIKTSK